MVTLVDADPSQPTEFYDAWRCHACIQHNQMCWIKKDIDGCILCTSQFRSCVFTRVVRRTAPRNQWEWAELVGEEGQATKRPE